MDSKQKLVEKIIHALSFTDAQVEYQESEENISIKLTLPQDESGILIGYRGEKIDALQYVFNMMLNQDSIHFKPVNLDINQYRQSREDSLRDMADTAAEKAVESGREILLPPLPANERRIIHMHLDSNASVSTYSEGEGASRRTVISPQQPEVE